MAPPRIASAVPALAGATSVANAPTFAMVGGAAGRAAGVPSAIGGGRVFDVNAVAYSPDGHHIVSGSDDNTVRLPGKRS